MFGPSLASVMGGAGRSTRPPFVSRFALAVGQLSSRYQKKYVYNFDIEPETERASLCFHVMLNLFTSIILLGILPNSVPSQRPSNTLICPSIRTVNMGGLWSIKFQVVVGFEALTKDLITGLDIVVRVIPPKDDLRS